MSPIELADEPIATEPAFPCDWPEKDGVRILPRGEDLPTEDGEPLETTWHRDAMNMLIENIKWWWRERYNYFVGGNMFVYFSEKRVFNKDFRGPDVFVALDVEFEPQRKSWVTWEEGDTYPDLIVELTSPSTKDIDLIVKKELYAKTFCTREYFIVDPDVTQIQGWRLVKGVYKPIVPVDGRFASEVLGATIGWWNGSYNTPGFSAPHPRLFDTKGNLIPIFSEAERQVAEAERQKAEVEHLRADSEKARADAAEAELARLRAELAAIRPS